MCPSSRLAQRGYSQPILLFDGNNAIEPLAIAPSESRVAFSEAEGNLLVFDIAPGKLLPLTNYFRKKPHTGSINHVTFGASDDVLLSSSNDTKAIITHLSLANEQTSIWFTLRDRAVDYSDIAPSGMLALSVFPPSSVVLWSTETGDAIAELVVKGCKPDESFNPSCQATQARFIPSIPNESDQITVGYRDRAIRLWSSDGALRGELLGHVGQITDLAVSHDGPLFVSASEDGSARLWRLNNHRDKDVINLRERFCQETDPLLLRYDASHDWDVHLNYKLEHDPVEVFPLMRELRVVDPCTSLSLWSWFGP